MSLNFDKLIQVASGLNIDVSDLFVTDADLVRAPVSNGRRIIDRVGEAPLRVVDHYRYRYLCTELKDRLMVPYYLEAGTPVAPTDSSDPVSPKLTQLIGELFVFVLEGPVEFHSLHYSTTVLQSGDCLYVDAEMPHTFVSPTGSRARLISVVTSNDEQYLEQARHAASRGAADASHRLRAQRLAALKRKNSAADKART
jgi:hypothetical protein